MTIQEDKRSFTLSAFRITQPIGVFFVGALDRKRLCDITDFDVRRILRERDLETYLGIQRPLNPGRVKEITRYVNTTDACFPTAIVLSVPGRCAEYNDETKTLTLSNYQDPDDPSQNVLYKSIAKVLDGQHRIAGLMGFTGPSFDINISVFIDLDIAEEAYIFSTVNLAQTKVQRSLAYDLFDLARRPSPQKLAHNIAVALDQNKTSPFYQRIKRLGVATEGRFNETLTQSTFVEALLPYLSGDPIHDRDTYMRGKIPPRVGKDEIAVRPFRNMMLDGKELEIAGVVFNYFVAVRTRWPVAWDATGRGQMLSKTNGFRALMRFLRDAYLSIAKPGDVPHSDKFVGVLQRVPLADADFNVERFVPGTSGEVAFYKVLKEATPE